MLIDKNSARVDPEGPVGLRPWVRAAYLPQVNSPQTHYARSGDAYIAYQIVGQGPIDLLLAPHFFHHVELWWEDRYRSRFVQALAESARVILLDKRGTGMSDRTAGVPPFDVQMDDVRAVLDAARSERSVLWAGGDATPMIALFAASFPERVAGLVLWDPFPTYIRTEDLPGLLTRADFEVAVAHIARTLEDASGASVRDSFPTITSDEELRVYWRVSRLGTSPGDHLAFTRVLAETDVRHVLPSIRVPTLVLSNEAYHENHAVTRYVAEKIPTARLTILAGGDSGMLVTDPRPIMETVRSFLDELRDLPPEEPDRVLATVLFTDIVGSTALSAELGDSAWRELLREHNARVRRELARFRGREVDTAGDGFFASFDGPARAIRCAGAIRDSLSELGLDVRAGLHTGECEVLDGKVTGIAVSLGARVAALAQPGEILVSSTVKDLVAGSGIRFRERGIHELKGVPGRWSLHAVE